MNCRIVRLPKGGGKYRTIYIPSVELRQQLLRVAPQILAAQRRLAGEHVHGFVPGRSCVTAARQHVGHRWTYSTDIEDFFDSCSERHLRGKVPKEVLAVALIDGAPRQGLPTSPALANVAASDLDAAILRAAKKAGHQIVYTRYADDLTISGDSEDALQWVRRALPEIVGRCGFRIAAHKTRIQYARDGRRIVLGLAVGDHDIQATRHTRRRIRAARHQGNADHAAGLEEYARCRPPRVRPTAAQSHPDAVAAAQAIARRYRLGNIAASKIPDKGPNQEIAPHVIITGDPVYMLGMSMYTTGWTSCHALTAGRKRGCVYWMHLRGTRLAALLHPTRTVSVAGVERRAMQARALVHTMRDGSTWYDRIYGDPQSAGILRQALEAAGIRRIGEAPPGQAVMGHAPARWAAWFDSMQTRTAKATAGPWKGQRVRICFV